MHAKMIHMYTTASVLMRVLYPMQYCNKLNPMAKLFEKIYTTSKIPEQWKVSKIIPTFKKGNKNEIENYKPIANLCNSSKIFERLILKQIQYLISKSKFDLMGKQQHGFKKNKSRATAGALLQLQILALN